MPSLFNMIKYISDKKPINVLYKKQRNTYIINKIRNKKDKKIYFRHKRMSSVIDISKESLLYLKENQYNYNIQEFISKSITFKLKNTYK